MLEQRRMLRSEFERLLREADHLGPLQLALQTGELVVIDEPPIRPSSDNFGHDISTEHDEYRIASVDYVVTEEAVAKMRVEALVALDLNELRQHVVDRAGRMVKAPRGAAYTISRDDERDLFTIRFRWIETFKKEASTD